MGNPMVIEAIGYVGSGLVLVSFLMSSVVKLRVINSAGGLIFAVYALLIHSYPTALMNFCLVGINVYYLARLRKPDRQYNIVEEKRDSVFLKEFLGHYSQDIAIFFPDRIIDQENAEAIYMICHGMTPAGVLLGKWQEEGVLDILLDYSTPEYRDCSVGKYLYSVLARKGVQSLVFSGDDPKHEAYLEKMGFRKENGVYRKALGR